MNFAEIIREIHEGRLEIQVLEYFQSWIINELKISRHKEAGLKASVRAISKINANKNEAISALCENDEEHSRKINYADKAPKMIVKGKHTIGWE